MNAIEDFHRSHMTEDWRRYTAREDKDKDMSFKDWMYHYVVPDKDLVSYTCAWAIKHGIDFDPFDDHLPSMQTKDEKPSGGYGYHHLWTDEIDTLYKQMMSKSGKAEDFTRKQYERILMVLLEMAGRQEGVMSTDEIMIDLPARKAKKLGHTTKLDTPWQTNIAIAKKWTPEWKNSISY